MKHYAGENIAFRHVLTVFSGALFAFVLSGSIKAQIPINGFCKYDSYPAEANFRNIYALNYNHDSYTDFAIFNSGSRTVVTYTSKGEREFEKARSVKLPGSISRIQPLYKSSFETDRFAFISRHDRTAGIVNFSASGAASITGSIKLNSFPDNLSTADLNGDGINELLLSGPAFDGLSLITVKNLSFTEKKIVNKKIFSFAVFADLNHDTYQDIAAVDPVNNKLQFYYNDSRSHFTMVREFDFSRKITFLKPYDMNLDGYQDLVFVQDNSINILLNDHTAAFSNKITVNTQMHPDEIVIGDFNNDGQNDLAYLSVHNSMLSILFAREPGRFFPEIHYFYKEDLVEIVPYYSKFVNGILALSRSGKVHLLSNLKILKDGTYISLGIEPRNVNYFDQGNDKITDMAYFDANNKSLDLLVRNQSGIPALFFQIGLTEGFKEMEIDDNAADQKTFYCYNKGKRLIEAVTVNFTSNSVSSEKFYAAGAICDLKLQANENTGKPDIYMLVRQQEKLSASIMSFNNFRYTNMLVNTVQGPILNAKLGMKDPHCAYYWKQEKTGYSFNRLLLGADYQRSENSILYSMPPGEGYNIIFFAGDFLNKETNGAANFIFNRQNKFAIITSDNGSYKASLKGALANLSVSDEDLLYLGEGRFGGLNKLFVYNAADAAVEKIDIIAKNKILLSTRVANSPNLESYFVKNMNLKKYHLVYTDKVENCIIIKEISL